MITEDQLADSGRLRLDDAAPDRVQREIEFLRACYRFSAALSTFRIAVKGADQAPGTIFFLEGECTPENARELHCRWAAASIVMHEAIDGIVKDGTALVESMKAVLTA
jgi:hypothetical protein